MAEDEPLRQSLRAAGFERAKQFSWEKTALEHLKIFKEVA
jgi:glycosyltransferase involved in cell wall biosynthesis